MSFGFVNAAEQQSLAAGYGIRGVPTIKFFCDGRPVYEVVGFRKEAELRAEIERVLSTHSKCISQSSPLYV
jgi:thioredoxin 1